MTPEEREQRSQRMRERGFDPTRDGCEADAAAHHADGRGAAPAAATPCRRRHAPARRDDHRRALRSACLASKRTGRVWLYVDKQLKPVRLRLGITDGQNTELIEGDLRARRRGRHQHRARQRHAPGGDQPSRSASLAAADSPAAAASVARAAAATAAAAVAAADAAGRRDELMSPVMTFRIAFKALGRNKMRTGLTMLGMIIGVVGRDHARRHGQWRAVGDRRSDQGRRHEHDHGERRQRRRRAACAAAPARRARSPSTTPTRSGKRFPACSTCRRRRRRRRRRWSPATRTGSRAFRARTSICR